MDLKPCPFCGVIPRFEIRSMGYGAGHGYPGCNEYIIYCNNKKCFVHPRVVTDDIYNESTVAQKAVVKRWNHRKE